MYLPQVVDCARTCKVSAFILSQPKANHTRLKAKPCPGQPPAQHQPPSASPATQAKPLNKASATQARPNLYGGHRIMQGKARQGNTSFSRHKFCRFCRHSLSLSLSLAIPDALSDRCTRGGRREREREETSLGYKSHNNTQHVLPVSNGYQFDQLHSYTPRPLHRHRGGSTWPARCTWPSTPA